MSRSWLSRLLFVGVVAFFVFGLNRLIHLRFESGRAYAPLSSLRTDPLGAKALHDAFVAVDGLAVERNYVPLGQLQTLPSDATVFVLNLQGYALFSLAETRVLREFMEDGGRLVLALDASNVAYEHLGDDGEDVEPDKDEPEANADEAKTDKPVSFTRRPAEDEWEIWKGLVLRHGEHEGGQALRAKDAPDSLPGELPWREGGVLAEFDDTVWTPVYSLADEVVAATRSYGEGSLVIMTDSYLFSNEALLRHRYAELLTWAVGAHPRIIFEETHLGVSERTGIAVLMRRYGLFEFVFAFACLMLLVVWRGAQPLLPAHAQEAKANLVRSERSIEAGFCDLVSREMRGPELPRQAFAIWKKSFIRNRSDEARYASELSEVEALLDDDKNTGRGKRRPTEIHSKIKSILNRKTRRHQ